MRLSLGAFLIIGLPIGIASAAEFHKVATPNLPPPVSVGTPVKFKRNVVACHSLDVRLQYFFDRGDPRELTSHHGTTARPDRSELGFRSGSAGANLNVLIRRRAGQCADCTLVS